MRILVTGSNGHLGEALMRRLPSLGYEPVGLDLKPGPDAQIVGAVSDRATVERAMAGVEAVVHTATLHKPHIATHSQAQFVETNISGTLTLLQEAARVGVRRFVFTSTTSVFGDALRPAAGSPAAWIDETVRPVPKNIYGVTKTAAEDLCALYARNHGLKCIVLRTSRFFLEADDDASVRDAYADANMKANEFLFRRVDLEDVATAHERAITAEMKTPFNMYVVSAPSPFRRSDVDELRTRPDTVVARRCPNFPEIYARAGFLMFEDIGRVYDSAKAMRDLDWRPRYDFARVLTQIRDGGPIGSALSVAIGAKGYHDETFVGQPYPVEPSPV